MSTGYDSTDSYDADVEYGGAHIFECPTYEEPMDYHPEYGSYSSLLGRLSIFVGKAVYKDTSGVWHTALTPYNNDLLAAAVVAYGALPGGENGQYVFLGGHRYRVSTTIANELTTAGYTVT